MANSNPIPVGGIPSHTPSAYQSPITGGLPVLNATHVGNNADTNAPPIQTPANPYASSVPGNDTSMGDVTMSHLPRTPGSAPASIAPTPVGMRWTSIPSAPLGIQTLGAGFQLPIGGQMIVAKATIMVNNESRIIPALCYQTNQGRFMIYPFTRTFIGTAWGSVEDLTQVGCKLENIPDGNLFQNRVEYCSRWADLPHEMVQQFIVSMECNGGGSAYDAGKLLEWKRRIQNPRGGLAAKVTCTQCGTQNDVSLSDVMYLTGISDGVSCVQLGFQCPVNSVIHAGNQPMHLNSGTHPTASQAGIIFDSSHRNASLNTPSVCTPPPPPPPPPLITNPPSISSNDPVISSASPNTNLLSVPNAVLSAQTQSRGMSSGFATSAIEGRHDLTTPGSRPGANTPVEWRRLEQMTSVGLTNIPVLPQSISTPGGTVTPQQPVGLINTMFANSGTTSSSMTVPTIMQIQTPEGTTQDYLYVPATSTSSSQLVPVRLPGSHVQTVSVEGSTPNTTVVNSLHPQPHLRNHDLGISRQQDSAASSSAGTPHFPSASPSRTAPTASPPFVSSGGEANNRSNSGLGFVASANSFSGFAGGNTNDYPFGSNSNGGSRPGTGFSTPPDFSIGLDDEVIEVGQQLYQEDRGRARAGRNQFHPSGYVRSRPLKFFTTAPPSVQERLAVQAAKNNGTYERILYALSRKVQDRTVPTFVGDGDVHDFINWTTGLMKHFLQNDITNSVMRQALAISTFGGEASGWWVSHKDLRPKMTLSWEQLGELVRTEMVPDGDIGVLNEGWADLRYQGDKALYFSKVRQMARSSTLEPEEVQMMASKPFGRVLVQRIKAALAARGLRALPLYEWEEVVTAYVDEVEGTPGFHSWPQVQLEPIFKGVRTLRQVTLDDNKADSNDHLQHLPIALDSHEPAPDVPPGMDDEEWDLQITLMQATMTKTLPQTSSNRIGKGERPCYCCGAEGHSWAVCNRRKPGKCGVCGGKDHLSRFCSLRFRPDPKIIAKKIQERQQKPAVAQKPTGSPGWGNPNSVTRANHASIGQSPDMENPNSVTSTNLDASMTSTTFEALSLAPLQPETNIKQEKSGELEAVCHSTICQQELESDQALMRQLCLPDECELALPTWLRKRWQDNTRRERIGKAIVPLDDPAKTGQLYYSASLDGKQGKMLYDPGASHCFLDWKWAQDNGIRIRACPQSSLHMFQGTAQGAIKWTYISNDFTLGEISYAWKFLVINPAPADFVLGLNFILHHKPEIDFTTLKLQPTAPKLEGKEIREVLCTENSQERVEKDWVSACGNARQHFLKGVHVTEVEDYAPFWDHGKVILHSATTEFPDYFSDWVAINETTKSSFCDDPFGMKIGRYYPYWEDDCIRLCSVTADSIEEQQQLQAFLLTLDQDLLEIVRKHESVFQPPDGKPPNRRVKHYIKLVPDALPIKRKPYPLPPHKLEAMTTQITELNKKGWIEKSQSAWGAPILFVPKKNGELRMCVDYRDLNAVTIDDCFPLPKIEVLLHRAANATHLTLIDLASGFHQVEVEEGTRPLTAFRLPHAACGSSLWQWTVMPFGLRNAPPTFQRAMTEALEGLEEFTLVYIDDILVFSNSRKEHLHHLDQVFAALAKHRYHVRLQKCDLIQDEVNFLGHRLTQKGISTQEEKVKALQGWKTPLTTPKQVKSLLGGFSWYKNYIPHFATLAAPLFALTSTKSKFQWTEGCENAVTALKNALLTAPVLVRWQQELSTRVVTDASKVGLGAVLEQKHPEGWKPVSFWSRKLKDPETRYSATDLEWLAVVVAVTRVWNWLLDGKNFAVCSDHKALERKLHKSSHDPPLNDRQARWIEALASFSYHFEWIKGAENVLADTLSRHPGDCMKGAMSPMLKTITVVHTLLAGLRKRLRWVAKHDTEYSQLWEKTKSSEAQDGEKYHRWEGLVVDSEGRVIIPNDPEIRTLLISEAHDSPLVGHFGVDKTLELVQRHWHWRGIQNDVRDYVRSCLVCQRSKTFPAKPPGQLHPIVPSKPWEIVTLDFVVGLPEEPGSRFSQILVFVDKFTKYVALEPCTKNIDAITTAQLFIKRIVSEHGVPALVISDRGPQFTATLWNEVLKSLGSRSALATTHHPQTDGQTERVIQTLSRLIRAFVTDQSTKWVQMLPLFQFSLNNSASAATKTAPFQILYGREPTAPVNLMLNHAEDKVGGMELRGTRQVVTWAREWWKARRKLCEFVSLNLQEGARRMKRRYDSKHRIFDAQPGDLVLLSTKSHPDFGEARKLRMRYTGPFVIKRKVHPNAYELSDLPAGVPPVQNVQFLRLFHPTPRKFKTRPNAGSKVGPVRYHDHVEWEVEDVVDHKIVNGSLRYLIKWCDHLKPSWSRVEQLKNCAETLREYQQRHGLPLDFWDESSSSPESESGEESGEESDEGFFFSPEFNHTPEIANPASEPMNMEHDVSQVEEPSQEFDQDDTEDAHHGHAPLFCWEDNEQHLPRESINEQETQDQEGCAQPGSDQKTTLPPRRCSERLQNQRRALQESKDG